MKISEIIAREDYLDPKQVGIFKENIRRYIDNSTRDQNEILAGRAIIQISPVQLKYFLRKKEREENTRLILQYLLMFLDKDPDDVTPFQKQITPEKQLHGFVRFQVNLLLERDVRKAILHEYSQLRILKTGNFWYYEGRITDTHKELSGTLADCSGQGPVAIIQLCRILERLSLFWFDLCREDVCRIRTSDLYIYKLALILQKSLTVSHNQ